MPIQERGRRTREKIVAAGEKLFGRRGFYDTDAKEIAREAGVAVGSFYAYFNDKRELFVEVLRRYNERVGIESREGLQSLRESNAKSDRLLKDVIFGIREAHAISPDFARESMKMALTDDEVSQILKSTEEKNLEVLEELLKSRADELRVKDIKAAAYVVSSAVEDTIHRLLINPEKIGEERILRELARMCHRYLFGESRKSRKNKS